MTDEEMVRINLAHVPCGAVIHERDRQSLKANLHGLTKEVNVNLTLFCPPFVEADFPRFTFPAGIGLFAFLCFSFSFITREL